MKTRVFRFIVATAASAVGAFAAGCDMEPYKPEYDEGYRNVQGSIWTTYDKPSQPK